MRITIRPMSSVLGLATSAIAFVAAATETGESGPSKPKPPKITFDNLDQMEELVRHRADPNAPIHYGRKLRFGEPEHPGDAPVGEYPLDASIGSRNPDLVKRLLGVGAKPKRNELGGASFLPNKGTALAMAKLVVEAGMDPNGEMDPQSIPPIILAISRGNVKLVEYLLAQPKIDVDKRDIDGHTALVVAASCGDAMIVEMLLKAGADPTLKDERGRAPADHARDGVAKFEDIIERLGRNTEDGADQPATAPESKSEGEEKPEPESEVPPVVGGGP